ncbi:MAG: LysR family transcriptional regulator [Gammaproteobacteria bacterium]|nr:LysR family transcriptional regulator [Gammaproteobacteria bacterium]
MNLRRLDLNLLVIFDALMAERHVTRAARRVSLSQPAFSNALARLRHYLKDDLFIRQATGMLPTPRALELAPHIHAALLALEHALDQPVFEPATTTQVFTLDTNDYLVGAAMPQLMQRLAALAPGVNVRVVPPNSRAFQRLDAREVDFVLGGFGAIPERYGVAIIEDNEFSCLMDSQHPLTRGKLDLVRYAAAKHLLITPRGDATGFVDLALAEHGLTRRIALTVNQFSVVPAIIANSDLIVTLPKRMAEQYAPRYHLAQRPSPVPTPAAYAHIQLLWLRRSSGQAALMWFANLLLDILGRAAEPR